MPRVYNKTLINEVLNGTAAMDSDSQDNELLGRADKIAVQFFVTNPVGTSPTLTATLWHSNDNRSWILHTTLLNAVSISSSPFESIADSGSANLGAFVRLRITLGGTNPSAFVRATVCGRTN